MMHFRSQGGKSRSTFPPTDAVRRLLTVEEVADQLGVAVKTIYQWRSRPEPYGPPAIKVGKYLRWKPEVVEAWIDAQGQA